METARLVQDPAPRSTVRRASLADAAAQQAAWWWAVLLVSRGEPALASAGPIAVVGAHLALRATARRALVGVALAAVALGAVADALLIALGLLSFSDAPSVPPAWMLGLWGAFGVALGGSLRALVGWPWWKQAPVAGVAGAFAYRAGDRFDALALAPGAEAAVFVTFALATVALVHVARRAFGRAAPDAE